MDILLNIYIYIFKCFRTGGSNILLNGRALYVMKAMDKEEANKVGPKTDKQKTLKKDRRNIYLANEGLLVSHASINSMFIGSLMNFKIKQIKGIFTFNFLV